MKFLGEILGALKLTDSAARDSLVKSFEGSAKKWLAKQAKGAADTAASESLVESLARRLVTAANSNNVDDLNDIFSQINGAVPSDVSSFMGAGRGSKAGKEAASARAGVAKTAAKEKKTSKNISEAATKRESNKRAKKIIETEGEPVKKKAPVKKAAAPKNPFDPDATAEDVANWKAESVEENARLQAKTGGRRKRRTGNEISKDEMRTQNRERNAAAALEQESRRRAEAGNPMSKSEENAYYKSILKRSSEAKQKRKDTGAARSTRKVVSEKTGTPGAKTGSHYEDSIQAEIKRGRSEQQAVKNVLRAAEMSLAKKKQVGKPTAAIEEQIKNLKARLKKLGG